MLIPKTFMLKVSSTLFIWMISSATYALPIITITDLSGNLAHVNVEAGHVENIVGNLGQVFRDLAYDPDNQLYGITLSDLYLIDPNTAITTPIGPHGIENATGLTFTPNGMLYAASVTDSNLYQIDPVTGASQAIVDTGFYTLGDVAYFNEDLYITTNTYQLVNINLDNVNEITPLGYVPPIYGLLDGGDGWLYGFYREWAFQIDPETGQETLISEWENQGLDQVLGAAQRNHSLSVPISSTLSMLMLGLPLLRIKRVIAKFNR